MKQPSAMNPIRICSDFVVLHAVKTEVMVVEAPKEKLENDRIGKEGKGTQLNELPRVIKNLGKHEAKARELVMLHR